MHTYLKIAFFAGILFGALSFSGISHANNCLEHGTCTNTTENGMYCVTCSAKNHGSGAVTTGKSCKSASAAVPTDSEVEKRAQQNAINNCQNAVPSPSTISPLPYSSGSKIDSTGGFHGGERNGRNIVPHRMGGQ
jgi:hypothetical protein